MNKIELDGGVIELKDNKLIVDKEGMNVLIGSAYSAMLTNAMIHIDKAHYDEAQQYYKETYEPLLHALSIQIQGLYNEDEFKALKELLKDVENERVGGKA